MPVRNAHWYNQNEGRSYPVDDSASAVADDAARLPPDIITDMNLRWPSTLGNHAFLAAVSNTDALVTVTVQAATSPDDTTSFTPLAVVSVRKPIVEGRMYPVQPQAPGVGGWIVFGSGIAGRTYRGRFSTPRQAILTPRAARPYRPLPVTSVQAQNAADKLTGVITLSVTEPLTLAKEERFLSGANRDCIVIRLVDGEGAEGFPVPDDATQISGFKPKSVFQQFAGPCSGRPESNTCGCPNPIEFINAVSPDCNGVITVEFAGCAKVADVAGGGIAVACELGLVDACLPAQIPSSEGLLPSEYEPANIPVPPDVVPEPEPDDGVSDSLISLGALPYVTCFNGLPDLTEVSGLWQFQNDDSPTVVCPDQTVYFPVSESLSASTSQSLSQGSYTVADGSYETTTVAVRNVAIFDVDETTVYRTATTEVKLADGGYGAKKNAQLIINHHPHASVAGQFVYFAAEIDYDTQVFRLLRFNGTAFQTVAPATAVAPGIQLDKWYRITATCLPSGQAGDVTMSIRLESISEPGVTDVSLDATVSNYQPSTGKFGVGTNRAISRFAYLKIEEAAP